MTQPDPMLSYIPALREPETLRIVKNSSDEHLKKIAEHLNNYGIINEVRSFTLPYLQYWTVECDNHLRNYGYKGGDLKSITEFYDGIGNCGVLFDTLKYSSYNDSLPCPKEYLNKHTKDFLEGHSEY